jgi:hypothetical protein
LCARDLTLSFDVTSSEALEYPSLEVRLLADVPCGYGYSPAGAALQDASRPVRFTAGNFVVGDREGETCPYPYRVASLTTGTARVSLRSGSDVVAEADFALSYVFAGPPVAATPTTPVVTELCWDAPGPTGGWCGDGPLPDDRTSYRCQVDDEDGDGLTVTLTFRSTDGCRTDRYCWTESVTFAPRPVPLPVVIEATHAYPDTGGATLSCSAIDSRGRSSRVESVCFGSC